MVGWKCAISLLGGLLLFVGTQGRDIEPLGEEEAYLDRRQEDVEAELEEQEAWAAAAADAVANEEDAEEERLPPPRLQDMREDPFKRLSVEAEQTLLDMKAQGAIGHLAGSPTPIYRKDLGDDYIAYWEVATEDGDFVIVSAGPRTGDGKLVVQSKLPSRTQQLNKGARDIEESCDRYFLINFVGDMMCENEAGDLVATTMDTQFLSSEPDEEIYTAFAALANDNQAKAMWEERAVETAPEWLDELVLKEDELVQREETLEDELQDMKNGVNLDDDDDIPEGALNAYAMEPGEPQEVALSNPDDLRFVEIRAKDGDGGQGDQKVLCSVVQVCDPEENTRVAVSAITTDEDTGLKMLSLVVNEMALHEIESKELQFEVLVHRGEDTVVIRRYAVEKSPPRGKRHSSASAWSGWKEKKVPCADKFPSYEQHTHDKNCSVGYAPVAWASVFAYMDRSSHEPKSRGCKKGGEALYRCGSNGHSGDDTCIAPSRGSSAVKKYMENLNDILGTRCFKQRGITLITRMKMVGDFYKSRQSYGKPRVVEKKTYRSHLTWSTESTAKWTRDRIDEGWPVIVGYKLSFLRPHFAVATGYRVRSRRRRTCWMWGCGTWKTEYDFDMYLHMGWGGRKDGYYSMRAYYATAAVY